MKRFITTGMVAIGLLASACSGNDPRVAEAKTIVNEQLNDPSSATFEDVSVQKTVPIPLDPNDPMSSGQRDVTEEEKAVCGWVNAENRLGAFTGAERFLVKPAFSTFRGGDESSWAEAFNLCIIHSQNDEATDRLMREGTRAIQAYSDAIDELNAIE